MTVLDTIPRAKAKASDDYLALVERFPLRSIETDRDLKLAAEVLDKLVMANLTPGEEQYLDALTSLVASYEAQHVSDLPKSSPHEMLAALMEHRGVSRKDLIKLLGSESAVSMILKGTRQPSKQQAKSLAKFFRVDAVVFL
jgi:HTH-type transcriptional regulator / antitoxin HigA